MGETTRPAQSVCLMAPENEANWGNRTTIYPDELQPFEIGRISPSSRSISPIDVPEDLLKDLNEMLCISHDSPEPESPPSRGQQFISLEEIDAKITPLKDRKKHLETIFEGIFLETPPKKSTKEKKNHLPSSPNGQICGGTKSNRSLSI